MKMTTPKLLATTLLATGFTASISAQVIDCVSTIAPEQYQTITIHGSGFGTHSPYNGDSDYLYILDNTGVWQAGYLPPDNLVTLDVTSWTDNKIVISGFTGDYGPLYGWTLQPGDNLTIAVWNPQTSAGPATYSVTVGVTNTCCQLDVNAMYHQGDSPPAVPTNFGFNTVTGQAPTIKFGCALCSLATMLTAFPGMEEITPAGLDAGLKNFPNHAGYKGRADVNWYAVGPALNYPIYVVDAPTSFPTGLDAYLQQQICVNGNAVILRLNETVQNTMTPKTHFVLVVGETNNDWIVFDPGWRSAEQAGALSTLSGHTHGFNPIINSAPAAFRQFSVAGAITYALSPVQIPLAFGTAQCPVEMTVTDPMGQELGYDPSTGQDIFEISGGIYIRDYPVGDDAADDDVVEGDPTGYKTFCVTPPTSGIYQVTSTGISNGAFAISLQTVGPSVLNEYTNYSGTASVGLQISNSIAVFFQPEITLQPTNQIISVGGSTTFAVQATGSTPLSYQWQKNSTNLMDGVNISGSATTSLTVRNVMFADTGVYSVLVTNLAGAVTSTGATLHVNLLQNGGFETGDFTGWQTNGDCSYTFVDNGTQTGFSPHAGAYFAALGTTSSLGYLSQTLSTAPSQLYSLSLWLNSPDGLTPNAFLVNWNGSTIFSQTNMLAFGWTNLQFTVMATETNTSIQFGFSDYPSYLELDDITVSPSSATGLPMIFSPAGLSNGQFQMAVNGVAGQNYTVQMSTSLFPANWISLFVTNPPNGLFLFTDPNATNQQRFYRVLVGP